MNPAFKSETLRHYRKEKGLTQKQIATILGISQQAYAQYESGARIPKIQTVNRIADALGVEAYRLDPDLSPPLSSNGPKGGQMKKGYTVKMGFFGKPIPQVVQVSFELPYLDWLQLEKSDLWRNLLEALEDAQTLCSHCSTKKAKDKTPRRATKGGDLVFPNLMTELKVNKYSQKGLAAYIGISERSMSKKLNGQVEFTLSEMQKIQSAFPNCTLDYLFVQYGQKE